MSGLPYTTTLNATSTDACGCCEPCRPEASVHNPPGLPALAYRIGTHSGFLRRMVMRLPKWTIPDGDHERQRPLTSLTTRSADDPAIALLDAWAVVADVITFYQERIANEGFLRTATERRSVLQLARAIGYELNPGVAASTWLVFTVNDAEQLPDTAVVPAGTQVQSIPQGRGGLPQTFETTDELEARVAWNAIRPRWKEPQQINSDTNVLYFEGVTSNSAPGDALLIRGQLTGGIAGERNIFRFVKMSESVADQRCTVVTLDRPLGSETNEKFTLEEAEVFAFCRRAALFGHNAPEWVVLPESTRKSYCALATPPELSAEDRRALLVACPEAGDWPSGLFRIRTADQNQVHLDTIYDSIVPDSRVVLSQDGQPDAFVVKDVQIEARADFTLTAKTTRLEFHGRPNLERFRLRDTVVYAESHRLNLAGAPVRKRVEKDSIELEGRVEGLQRDQLIIVRGKLRAAGEEAISEVAVVDSITPGDEFSTLKLQQPLSGSYERSTVTIYANVVRATHGETVTGEVLGSGDGTQVIQTFKPRKPPLTFVSSADGSQSTLSVRVDRVEWQQVSSLFNLPADSRSYTVRINDDAEPSVIFGDGRHGARLPTGQENVVATYRSGIGAAGNVGGGSLSLLKTKPYGIRSVTNPRAASGGEDPERLEDARKNAPVTVLTLDRVVSLRDYEDYARSFPGIGKARADTVWTGEAEVVHLTVATSAETAVEDSLRSRLYDALSARRDPLQELRVSSFEGLWFSIHAAVLTDPGYDWNDVSADIRTGLERAFSFSARSFGQPVSAAGVVQVMHAVSGVVAVDLNSLRLQDGPSGKTSSGFGKKVFRNRTKTMSHSSEKLSLANVLQAERARFADGELKAAQLLLTDATLIQLTEMQP